MKLKRYGILIALLVLMPLLTAGTTVFNSRQLAPSPASGDILFSSDGKNNEWRPPESVGCCDLDETYDAGATIDYTGAVPVSLAAVTAHNPSNFLNMTFDGNLRFNVSTAGEFQLYDAAGLAAFQFFPAIGVANFNTQMVSTGDLTWSGLTAGLTCDASADCVSIVPTEYLGDADTAGNLYIADGSANYAKIVTPAMAGDLTFTLWSAYPGVTEMVTMTDAGVLNHAAIPADTDTIRDSYSGSGTGYVGATAATYLNFNALTMSANIGVVSTSTVYIVGISVCCYFRDTTDVATLDIIPYANGAAVNAACKLNVAESTTQKASVTFATGTYSVAANNAMSVVIQVLNDLTGPDSTVNNIIVTVWYQV